MKDYNSQIQLLLSVLPEVAKEKNFALHGGTAINLFDRNLPRLSVDIDLTFLLLDNRDEATKKINESLEKIQGNILRYVPGSLVEFKKDHGKLWISRKGVVVKVEVNMTKRGCFEKPVFRELCIKAQDRFNNFCVIQCVEEGHLYGGKLCAALDRQHPRDLFDVWLLLQNQGINENIKIGFIFYLLSSGRPVKELLFPNFIDQRNVFENQFSGMTEVPFYYDDYIKTRKRMVGQIHKALKKEDIIFIISFIKGKPEWDIYDFSSFPAIQWKLFNIEILKRRNPEKHRQICMETEKALFSVLE